MLSDTFEQRVQVFCGLYQRVESMGETPNWVAVRAATMRIFSLHRRQFRLTQNPHLLAWIINDSFDIEVHALWNQSRAARERETRSTLRPSYTFDAPEPTGAAIMPRTRPSNAKRAMCALDAVFGLVELIVPANIADDEIGDARERIVEELERSGEIGRALLDGIGVAACTIVNAVRDWLSRF